MDMEKFYGFMVHPVIVAIMTIGTIYAAIITANAIVKAIQG